jgi:hypothetical protein
MPFLAFQDEAGRSTRERLERRTSVRLFKCWDAARGDEALPAIRDFDFDVIEDLRSNIFLLGLEGVDELPVFRYIGKALTQEVGRDLTHMSLAQAPRPSLLAQVADQYLRAVAKRQPIGLQEIFAASADKGLYYRGILLPFSENGVTVDLVLGAYSFRPGPPRPATRELSQTPSSRPSESQPLPRESAAEALPHSPEESAAVPAPELMPEPLAEPAAEPDRGSASLLAESLTRSRALAREAQESETGSRRKLYGALEAAYAFFLEAETDSEGYARLLGDAGLSRQERAPFTPVVKLVFGADFPKTQLSEYAATLSHARRLGRPAAALADFIEAQEGGLKSLVRAEREARRAEQGTPAADHGAAVRDVLRQAESLGEARLIQPIEDEFILLLGRRAPAAATPEGRIELVAIEHRTALLETVLRLAARNRRREIAAERRKAGCAAKNADSAGDTSTTPTAPATPPVEPGITTDVIPADPEDNFLTL